MPKNDVSIGLDDAGCIQGHSERGVILYREDFDQMFEQVAVLEGKENPLDASCASCGFWGFTLSYRAGVVRVGCAACGQHQGSIAVKEKHDDNENG
jgi:hypothetical protein